jgi:outer membrane protein W
MAGFQPYLDVGALYFSALSSRDGSVQQFEVDNKFGTALQAGVSYRITPTIVRANLTKGAADEA